MTQKNLLQFFKRSYNDLNANEAPLFLKPLQPGIDIISPPPTKRLRISNSGFDSDENQMIIDAGQKRFGTDQCKVCGMVYDPTFGPDSVAHQKFHDKTLNPMISLPKCLSKIFLPAQEFVDGAIYKITTSSPRLALQIVEELNSLMNIELGETNRRDFWKNDRQVYVFVNRDIFSFDRKIVGCLIVDQLKYAFKYLTNGTVDDRPIYSILGKHFFCF